MTWMEEMDIALERGGSPVDAMYVLNKIRRGEGRFFAWPKMRASVIEEDGLADIGHVYGEWTIDEARELLGKMGDFARDRGLTTGRAFGRPGWKRFLRMKGCEL